MSEAAVSEKRASQRQKTGSGNNFEDTFKPQKSRVNFGALKNEKKKKGKSPPKAAILLLAVIVLLAGAGAALYFTGYLTPVLQLVGLAEPTQEAQPTLEEREALLAIKEESLSDREEALNKREEQLAEKEAELAAMEESTEDSQTFGEMLDSLTDEELEDLKRISTIYSKMDSAEAAGIMESMYDLTEISAVIYYMQPAASALVLEQMEAGKAADITEIMLN